MIVRIFLFLFLGSVAHQLAKSQEIPEIVDIRIFTSENVQRFSFTPAKGRYIICDHQHEKLLEIRPYNTLVIEKQPEGYSILYKDSLIFAPDHLTIQGTAFHNSFVIVPLDKKSDPMVYDGDLRLAADKNNQSKLINSVPFESYVAGTVQSESGFNRHDVFYQVQAIIIRTYALKNINRHAHEGFHLCDQVHCQAYKGKAIDPGIIHATENTRGEVLTKDNSQLLNTVYHANCGGQTVNSEDMWSQALPYLRSKTDNFCSSKPGALWDAKIAKKDFKAFLKHTFGFIPDDEEWDRITTFSQNHRKHYLDANKNIHLRQIREHFGLRSTYFSIQEQKDTLHLSGRGYGHGVGLCQEGAMQRANHGLTREDILQFYYNNSQIIFLEPDIVF